MNWIKNDFTPIAFVITEVNMMKRESVSHSVVSNSLRPHGL